MRKLFTFLCAALMSVGMWADPTVVASGNCGAKVGDEYGTNLTWKYYSDNSLVIEGSGAMADFEFSYATFDMDYPWISYRNQITSVSVGEGITTIGNSAFSEFTDLQSISLPSTLQTIGSTVFYYCEKLPSITIPANVTSIGVSTFSYCELLASANIPVGVTLIPESLFYDCHALQTIVLPEGVQSIGEEAFYSCYGLTNISFPSTLTQIGDYAFNWSTSLASITLPTSIESISEAAFAACSSLTNVTMLGSTPATLGEDAFATMSSSLTFTVPTCELIDTYAAAGYDTYLDANSQSSSTSIVSATGSCDEPENSCGDGLTWEYNSTTNALTISYDGSGTGVMDDFDYVHPAPWESYRESITSVIISNGVTSIGENAFENCTGMTSVTIPNSVTSIGYGAFENCSGLTSVTIPNGVTSIELRTFMNCYELESVTIPSSVTSIGTAAFGGCIALTSIEIPNSVLSIDEQAFAMCGLTSITIPNSVLSIGETAFWACTGLTSVIISDGVPSIGVGAFYYCTALTSIEIPNSVTSIGDYAFYECTGLETVTINATTPPTLGSDAFLSTAEGLTIYVPAESKDDYKAGWAAYADKIVAIPGGGSTPTDEQVPTNADPENPSYYYSTFFHSTQNYKLTNDGTTAFIADLSGSDLILTEIAHGEQVIPANTAVIFRKAGSADPVVLTPTEENGVSVNPEDNDLQGVDAITAVTSIDGLTRANCYVLSGQEGVGFYLINSDNLKAHKAYVKYVSTPGQNNAPRRMRFVFEQENTTTGVESAQPSVISGQKLIENGQLVIIKNGVRYNAQGQIVK